MFERQIQKYSEAMGELNRMAGEAMQQNTHKKRTFFARRAKKMRDGAILYRAYTTLSQMHRVGGGVFLRKLKTDAAILGLMENKRFESKRDGISEANVEYAAKKLRGMVETGDIDELMREIEEDVHVAEMIGHIPGFFPTPPDVARMLVSYLAIGEEVLEPSAGSGALCTVIKDESPSSNLTCVEFNNTLANRLASRGYNVVRDDFLQWNPEKRFDSIVMNPPFERNAWIHHLEHAWNLLVEDGSMIAITPDSSKGPNFDYTIIEKLGRAFAPHTSVATQIIYASKE